jgi:2-polyprenyl-3-methyl-5-hydroxy-6-metoxy-1,4-benzoquinol methylase
MNTTRSYNKKNCRLCHSTKLKTVYRLKRNPIGDNYTKNITKAKLYDLKLNICESCKFIQLSNVINPNKVYGDYLYVTKTSSGLSEHFYELGKLLIKKKIISKQSKILEIGCNDGTLLKFFENKCAYLLGIDPAAHLFKDNTVKTIKGLFNYNLSKRIKMNHGKFDVIIANNVIANIDNLEDVFLGINNIISEEGFLIIETFALYGIIKNNLIDNIYHEHLSYFSIETLKKFSQKFNLNLIKVNFLSVKGGSLRFIFKKEKIFTSKKIINLIYKEKNILANIENKFKMIQLNNNYNKIKIKNFIKKIKKKRKKIAGFGASVGTTTLVYDFMLTKSISYIFDNEKRRFDLYLPGTSIQVLDPGHIKDLNLDYIIIFAWRYAKLIIKKNKKMFNNKIKFVLPLPKFKIIK